MKENSIFIKEKRKDLFTRGFIVLALMIVSLLCAFAPILMSGINDGAAAFYIIGGLLFTAFLSMFVYLLYKEFHPNILLILGSRGFVDKKNVGDGIEIEWTNVASVKLLGNKEMPYLGITLENSDIVMAKMKKREAEEMRDNIDESLPHILIAQNEVYIPISELKDTFARLVRESRILNSDNTAQKTKHNPFTTDDVLRAFGKLPSNSETHEEYDDYMDVQSDEHDNTDQHIISDMITYTSVEQSSFSAQIELDDTPNSPDSDIDIAVASNPSDSADITSDIETDADEDAAVPLLSYKPENDDASFDELSAEINEFFSRAKFSKISELGKILNENDVPYSISKEKPKAENGNESIQNTDSHNLTSEETLDHTEESDTNITDSALSQSTVDNNDSVSYINDFNIVFPDNLFNDNDVQHENSELTFESLIQQSKALDELAYNSEKNKSASDPEDNGDLNMSDTKEY